jgi:heme A synthase
MPSLIETIFSKESLFAVSLFPYLGFLWFMTKKIPTPKVALIGFYLTLLFVAVTIPIGAYAQLTLHKSLADVDLLHGGAEFFLTLSNITIAIGFGRALKSLKTQSSAEQ